jgi:hypothetical protein
MHNTISNAHTILLILPPLNPEPPSAQSLLRIIIDAKYTISGNYFSVYSIIDQIIRRKCYKKDIFIYKDGRALDAPQPSGSLMSGSDPVLVKPS